MINVIQNKFNTNLFFLACFAIFSTCVLISSNFTLTNACGEQTAITHPSNVTVRIESNQTMLLLNKPINLKYIVVNQTNESIYLVIKEKPLYAYKENSLELAVEKYVNNPHSFDFPELVKIKPRQQYVGCINNIFKPPQDFIEKKLSSDIISLSVSVGYLNAKGFKEINTLLKQIESSQMANLFNELQIVQSSDDIKVTVQ